MKTQAAEIQEGDPFPRLELPSMRDGSPLAISDFHGRKTVLHNFASW